MIYATGAQTNGQTVLLFLSLNEKETLALNVIRIRYDVGICVSQCGVAVSTAQAQVLPTTPQGVLCPNLAFNDMNIYPAEQLVT